MRNTVLIDKKGRPDIMVAYKPEELGLPEILKGRKVAEYMIGKYQAHIIDGVPYSMPYMQPAVNISHDEAIRLCEAKGAGWHLITNDEWTALARQSLKNGTLPRGNTNGGKSHSHPEETGTTYDGNYGKTLTGSGPVTWNHDHTAEGVTDMCGNIWEHVGGIRFMNGQAQVIPNNGAAAGADQSKDSTEWEAIYTPDGDPVYFNPCEGEILLEPTEADAKDYDGVRFTELKAKGFDVPDKLIELGLYPAPDYNGTDYIWVDNDDERCVCRGGCWSSGSNAGVFYVFGYDSRSSADDNLGFRSAFVSYSGDSGDLENLENEATDLSDAPEEIKNEIKENNEKLIGRDALLVPKTLPEILRYAAARKLADLYREAGGKDHEVLFNIAYNATPGELEEAAKICPALEAINEAGKIRKTTQEEQNHDR